MLHRVGEYVERHGVLARPGFKRKLARFAIVCDSGGKFEGVVELGDPENPGREFEAAPDYTQPEMKFHGGFGHRAQFLLESASAVVLYGLEGLKDNEKKKAENKQRAFLALIREAARATGSPGLRAVESALTDSAVRKQICAELNSLRARPTENVTFRIGEEFPVEQTHWHAWWQRHRQELQREMARKKKLAVPIAARCFLTGQLVVPARTFGKVRIHANAGGMGPGNALVSFDEESTWSFGLEQSVNAAMSEAAGKVIESGLNELTQRTDSSHVLAGVQIVHWFRQHLPKADDVLDFLFDPAREEHSAERRAHELLDAIRTGKRAELGQNEFYVLMLSGTGGRVMVRGWQEGRFEQLVAAVDQWFSHLRITNLSGTREADDPGIEAVVTSLLPEKKPRQEWRDWVRPVASLRQSLWDAAVRGTPIPWDALARVVIQFRSFCLTGQMDQLLARDNETRQRALVISRLYCRMALIKAYHLRKQGRESMSNDLSYLNPDHPEAAYQCGRMMAVLADLQRAALGDVGANVIQRYYAAASATPALVFGRLTRNATYHLDKLQPGLAHWYEERLASIASRLGWRIPTTLSLEQQSLFALGYYQQIAQNNADRRAAKSRKSNSQTPEESKL